MPIGTVLFSSRAPVGYIAIAAQWKYHNMLCDTNQVVPNENVGYILYVLSI